MTKNNCLSKSNKYSYVGAWHNDLLGCNFCFWRGLIRLLSLLCQSSSRLPSCQARPSLIQARTKMADPRLVGQQASVPGVFAYLLARHGGSVALLTCLPNEVCYVHPHEVAGASFFATNSWRHFGSLLWVCPPQISTQHFCTPSFRVEEACKSSCV